MSERELELAERVLGLCDAGADAEVTVRTGRSALTRFANSFIHQNVAEDVARVALRLSYDGRSASAATTFGGFDLPVGEQDEALGALVARTAAAARLRPVDPTWPGLTPAAPTAFGGVYDAATAEATPADRAGRVADFVGATGGLEAAGFCETVGETVGFANSAGQRVAGRHSTATLDGVARTQGADGSARAVAASLADIDGAVLGHRAATGATSAVEPRVVEPGHYEVVLEPSCVADVLFFLAWQGFNGRAVNEGRSCVRLGEQLFDPSVQLWDDAADPRTVGLPFDADGTPKRRVDLVRAGVPVAVTHDLRTAAVAGSGATSTGHAVEGGESDGAIAGNLLLGTGSAHVDELVGRVGRGLLVTDFWYTRLLDPRTLVVTGLTRNGVFLIEDGAVVAPVANLRFTQSYVEALGPGQVLGIGDAGSLQRQYAGLYSVPSLHLASWNFTGGAKG